VYVWSIARAFGGRVVLRIEDHDRGRCRPEYERAILDDLDWLGLLPDVAPTAEYRAGPTPFRQSDGAPRHEAALAQLERDGVAYPCDCSRRQILRARAEAPEVPESSDATLVSQVDGAELPYPGNCRSAHVSPSSTAARRLRLDDRIETFADLRLGPYAQQPSAQCGDVLIRDRHAQWTYQFAVVVDDFAQDIDLVIRGEDLLLSTGRQLAIGRLLGRSAPPAFLHHPLVRHEGGAKLSKSNHDTGLRAMRESGQTPGDVLGLAAQLGGLQDTAASLDAADLARLWG
jgi:glutamyl-tRNA synthetase/glutamyl-Q tRNA(Asp) synthetase